MRVTAWKTVEVECECEVGTEEILAEFRQRADEAEPQYTRRLCDALNAITKILEDIPQDVIDSVPKLGRAEMARRLKWEAGRWGACFDSLEEIT